MSKLLSTPSQPIKIIVTPSTPSPYTSYPHAAHPHSHSYASNTQTKPRTIHHSPIIGSGVGEKHTAYASGSGYVSRVLDFGSTGEGVRGRSFEMTYEVGDEGGYDSEKAGLISSSSKSNEEGEYELSTISSPYTDSTHYSEPSHHHYPYSSQSQSYALLSPSAPYISHSHSHHSSDPTHPHPFLNLSPPARRRLNVLAFMLALTLMALGFVSVIHPEMGGRRYSHGEGGWGVHEHALKRGEVVGMGRQEGMEFGLEDGFSGLVMGVVQSTAGKERAFNLRKRNDIPSAASTTDDDTVNIANKMHIGFVPFPLRHEYDINHPHASKSTSNSVSEGVWSRIKRDLIPLPFAKAHWGSGSVEGKEEVPVAVAVLDLNVNTEVTSPEAETGAVAGENTLPEQAIEIIQFPENEADGQALDEAVLAKNPRVRVLTAKEVQRMLLEESWGRMEKRRKWLEEVRGL